MSLAAIAHALSESSATAPERLKYLKDGKKIALYGAGTVGRDLMLALKARGYPVEWFLDRNAKPGQTLEGCPVLKPGDESLVALRASIHVIVAIYNAFTDVAPVFRDLRAAGWTSVTSILEIYQLLDDLEQRHWLAPTKCYCGKADEILSAGDLWYDRKSRELYQAIIEFRLTGNYDLLPAPEPLQYFPSDVPPWSTPLRLIDCGAFDGDTLRAAEQLKIPIEAVAAFEPDADNYEALVRQRNSAYFNQIEISLWPCGVHAHTSQLRFSSGLGTSSFISQDGVNVIQCVAIDDCLNQFRPNFVKMDIESAEYDALKGAAQTIQRHRPGLAVCLYHRPDDIWRIPALIRDWNLGYQFYLRAHAHNGLELILYAIA